VQHRTTPDDGLVAGIQESHGDNLQAVRQDRFNALVADRLGLRVGSDHERNIWPVDVGVQQPNLVAHFRQSQREIHR